MSLEGTGQSVSVLIFKIPTNGFFIDSPMAPPKWVAMDIISMRDIL